MKLCVIGAGSVNWMARLMKDIYLLDSVSEGEIALYDIEDTHIVYVAEMLKTFNKQRNKGYKVKIYKDRKKALEGSDYIITTFSPGSLKGFYTDLEVPIKYGIRFPVSMTVGVPGISAAIRTVPVCQEMMEDMEEVCPGAWLFNLTNPMSLATKAFTEAARTVKVVGLCHEYHWGEKLFPVFYGIEKPEGIDTLDYLYKYLPERGVEHEVAGINHFIWLIKSECRGQDMLGRIREICFEYPSLLHAEQKSKDLSLTERSAGQKRNNSEVKFALCRQFGYLTFAGDRHLIEFLPSLCNVRNGYGTIHNVFKTTIDERIRMRDYNFNYIKRIANEDEKPDWKRSDEEVSMIIDALITGKSCTAIMNLKNRGQIDNVENGATVETFADIDEKGEIHPHKCGAMPSSVAEIINYHIGVQELVYKAAIEGDRKKLIEAVSMDLSTAHMDFFDIPKMVEELLINNKEYLPRFFKSV